MLILENNTNSLNLWGLQFLAYIFHCLDVICYLIKYRIYAKIWEFHKTFLDYICIQPFFITSFPSFMNSWILKFRYYFHQTRYEHSFKVLHNMYLICFFSIFLGSAGRNRTFYPLWSRSRQGWYEKSSKSCFRTRPSLHR